MAKLYTNENFPQPSVDELRRLGYDVLTSHEAGNSNQRIPDPDVLNYATEKERVRITFNRKHFIALHKSNGVHSGIVVCTVDNDFVALAQRIDVELKQNGNPAGMLIKVNRH